jgi:hypothetical protein
MRTVLVVVAFLVSSVPAWTGMEEFRLVHLRIQVCDETNQPVPQSFVKAYSKDWPVVYPHGETMAQTGADGICELRVPRGSWMLVAGGGDRYNSPQSGAGLFLVKAMDLEQDATAMLKPDRVAVLRFFDRGGNLSELDTLLAAPFSLVPNCQMPEIGATLNGVCRIQTSGNIPVSLFLIRKPAVNREGYFLVRDGQPLSEALDFRADRIRMKHVRFSGFGVDGKPGPVDWSVLFPYQDTLRPWIHTGFQIAGRADAYLTADYVETSAIIHCGDAEDWHYYFLQQGLDLTRQPSVQIAAGGRLTPGLSILNGSVYRQTQFLLGPTQDAHGNTLGYWFNRKGRNIRLTVRENRDGKELYAGMFELQDNQPSFFVDRIFPRSAVFRLEYDLGPNGGPFVQEGDLYDPAYAYRQTEIPTDHFVIHAPADLSDKARLLAQQWEQAYAGICQWFPHEPRLTDEKHFYIDPVGSWAGLQGQELFWSGFVSWHPRKPIWRQSDWAALSLHEIGHRLESELFQPEGIECHLLGIQNEVIASLIRLIAVETICGAKYAEPHRRAEAQAFFDYLDNPENPSVKKDQNLRFVIQSYLPHRYGSDLSRGFFRHWVSAVKILHPQGYNADETFAALYSVIAGDDLWWIFERCGFQSNESRIRQAMQLLPTEWKSSR